MLRSIGLRWTIRGAGFALGVAIVVAILALAVAAIQVLLLVFVAVLLASGLEPLIGWLRSRIGIGRGLTILLVYAAFLVLLVGFVVLVVPAAIRQANETIQRLPGVLDDLRGRVQDLRPQPLAQSLTALVDTFREAITPPPPNQAVVVSVGLTLAQTGAAIVTLLAVVFFWLVEHARLQRYALAFLPLHRRASARDAWNEIETRLGLWVRGQLTLMLTIGLATGIAYTALGLPSSVLLAVTAALCEAIPIVGPFLGAVPAVLVAATVSPELLVAVALVYVVLQAVEGNVLVPLVMRGTIGLSPFLVLLSLLVGAAVGGVPGAFVAVPAAAVLEAVLERLEARAVAVAPEPSNDTEPDDEKDLSARLPDARGGIDKRSRQAARVRRPPRRREAV